MNETIPMAINADLPTMVPFYANAIFLTVILPILLIWSAVWKGIALWKSGKRKQLTWFIFLFIFNTAGILPIIYLIINRKKK
ncbi:MAG TPA: DUF5652 family protein [Candidatus Absconditabacterales bacterium]|nr:DUF5652 family protein [Candidatus Absconditabacterales bacterium]